MGRAWTSRTAAGAIGALIAAAACNALTGAETLHVGGDTATDDPDGGGPATARDGSRSIDDAPASPPPPPTDGGATDARPDAASSPYRAAVLADAPLAYWPFDEVSGTKSFDLSGNGRDALHVLEVQLRQPGALPSTGTAIAVEKGSGATAGDVLDLPAGAPFSLEAWIHAPGPSAGHRCIIGKSRGTNGVGYHLFVDEDLSFHIHGKRADGTTAQEGVYNVTVPLGAWTHVVATFDGRAAALYVDGALVGTKAITVKLEDTTSPLVVGMPDCSEQDIGFNGQIDEVAVYGTALGADRVRAHRTAAATD
jgi:hypothetical protein